MGLRRRSIRLRIILLVAIPILSLIGLYAFAATITASDAINLARAKALKADTGTPTGNLESQVDAERLLAVIYLAAPAPQNLAALKAQEQKTDKADTAFRAAMTSSATLGNAGAAEKQAIATLIKQVERIPQIRAEVASQSITRPEVINAYGDVISAADIALNKVILQETNVPLTNAGLTLVRLARSEEMLLREDALLTGDMAARTFSAADRQEFTQLVGARRALYDQTLPDLDPVYRAYYTRDISPQASATLEALENHVIADPHPASPFPPVNPTTWSQSVQGVTQGLSKAAMQSAETLTVRAQQVASSTYRRLILVGGLGLLAVILSIVISIWIGRGLVQQLAALRRSALELANKRLPSVMERLRAGQDVDVAAEAPPLEPSADEIGQVQEAFNAVQRTAVEAAVDEARLRRGVSDVFRNLARRSQSLLHRQLALLDAMERRASEPEALEDLFRIDHLTTRMRRHSEGLIILSGDSPGRGWRNPVPLVDVLRAAVAEVEDYTRIRVTTGTHAGLIGPAVADVIHLIAELAENATIYSPPNAPVRIHGDVVGRGFAVEIEDRGLGIAEDKLAEINSNLAHPPQFDLSGSEQLGLFVAGQLARRHDIRITLQPSPFGGITAIVLLPKALIVDEGSYEIEDLPVTATERAIRLTGRHATLNPVGSGEMAALTLPGIAPPESDGTPADLPLPSSADDPLTRRPAADPLTSPAGDLPFRRPASDLPSRQPGTGLPTRRPAADPLTSPAGDLGRAAADPLTRPAENPLPSPTAGLSATQGSEAPPVAAEPDDEPESLFTPRRPRTPTPPGSPGGFGQDQPPSGSSDPDLDPRVTTTELVKMGLPVRRRRASLAPQLRDNGVIAHNVTDRAPRAPSPEAARSTMTSLQRGWERGRDASGVTPSFDAALTPEPNGDGDEQRSDE
ncbi:MAG TPA: nitrate- and nitrite sensing domain-containing protein [Streptosporangiaceae bacterium]